MRSLFEFYYALIDYFNSPHWIYLESWFKFISSVVSAILFAGVVYLVVEGLKIGAFGSKMMLVRESLKAEKIFLKKIEKQWQAIEGKIKKGDRDNLAMAIIEADKIFDDLLKQIGYRGETMADRLKQMSVAQLPNIEGIWNAHKLRNRIAHDTAFNITSAEAKEAIGAYKVALKYFQALD